ncbi:type III secretion pathway protein [Oleiphilus messinensis]|uniref:Type III secretion pathway protein n=1 Tax=Oleiphilus messinensis TaxID=141451 RepID=A0A1Y0IHV5_9GAMM|nr:FHA domain-containing protein [Oleiphilus messinensis]ARU59436.1 type III secretion pathway protein [Oleiphilus messinensis]
MDESNSTCSEGVGKITSENRKKVSPGSRVRYWPYTDNETDGISEGEETRELFVKILSGAHAGAVHVLQYRDLLLIGNVPECEVILSDEGVQPRHCMLGIVGTEIWLRPIDGPAWYEDRKLVPGDTRTIPLNQVFRIGGVEIRIEVKQRDQREGLSTPVMVIEPEPRKRQLHWGKLFYFTVPVLLFLLSIALFLSARYGVFPNTFETLPDEVSNVANPSVTDDGSDESPAAQTSAADAKRLVNDVKEILRLSGIWAETRYLGDGRVEVSGHFGEGEKLAKVIHSRAMRDIEGLQTVVARNLDEVVREADESRRVASVVHGLDPYLVMADGSIYYLGAILPGGHRLEAIEGPDIVISTPEGLLRIAAVDAVLGQ